MHPQHHTLFIDYCAFSMEIKIFECHEVLEEYWKDIAPGDKSTLSLDTYNSQQVYIIGDEIILLVLHEF